MSSTPQQTHKWKNTNPERLWPRELANKTAECNEESMYQFYSLTICINFANSLNTYSIDNF